MHLARTEDTIPAFPLGQPIDGRPRFGMTHDQAALYRWLLDNRTHHKVFTINFRSVARLTGSGVQMVHFHVTELVDRGWLHREAKGKYSFVQPIMRFREGLWPASPRPLQSRGFQKRAPQE